MLPGEDLRQIVCSSSHCELLCLLTGPSYGNIGERLAKLNRMWNELFERAFAENYETIHRRETSQLRNNAQFWGHMLAGDAISWHVLSVISLNENDTTSSSRIFIKILIQAIVEALGMAEVQKRFSDEIMKPSYNGLFPLDEPRNTRFAINYFTSIGMGQLTEGLREHLKNAPKPAPVVAPAQDESDSESVSSYTSYSGSSRSYSRSRSRSRSPSRSRSRSNRREPAKERRRYYPSSHSRSPPSRRSRVGRNDDTGRGRASTTARRRSPSYSSYSSRSRSPPRRTRRSNSFSSRSRSPPDRYRRRQRSPSYSSRSRSPPRRRER